MSLARHYRLQAEGDTGTDGGKPYGNTCSFRGAVRALDNRRRQVYLDPSRAMKVQALMLACVMEV